MTLWTKILGAMALVLAMTVGGSFIFLIRYKRAQHLRNTAEATSHLANTIRGTLEHAMLANDPNEIQRIVLTVGQQPGIAGIFVLDQTGVVKVASVPGQVGQPLRNGPAALPTHAPDRTAGEGGGTALLRGQASPVLRSTSLIPNASRCQGCHPAGQPILGALVLDRSLAQMERQLRASLAYMLGSAGLAFLLLIGTTYAVLRRLVITPLTDLGLAARAIEAGNYDVSMTLDRSDEVRELVRTLDQMRRRILEHVDEVRRWGQELELRVAERTQELHTLNRVALVTNEALDLATIFSRALEVSLDALGVRAAAIILVAPELEGPIVVQQGLEAFEVEELTSHVRQNEIRGICSGVATHREDRRFACFPIRSKDTSLGVLCADDSSEAPLASEKPRLLEALAAQLGGTVERAILHQNLEHSFRELQESQAAVLERERRIAALEAVRAATVTMSHHINNATAGIAGCRNVVSMTLGDQADWQVRYALEGIQESVKKITAVLWAMGELTRITLTDFPGGLKAIDVDEAIRKALAQLPSSGATTQGDPPRRPA